MISSKNSNYKNMIVNNNNNNVMETIYIKEEVSYDMSCDEDHYEASDTNGVTDRENGNKQGLKACYVNNESMVLNIKEESSEIKEKSSSGHNNKEGNINFVEYQIKEWKNENEGQAAETNINSFLECSLEVDDTLDQSGSEHSHLQSDRSLSMLSEIIQTDNIESAIFKCRECDYISFEKSELHIHVMGHGCEIKKAFKCQSCNYSSTKKSNLQRHLRRSHLEQNPFQCEFCDYNTAERQRLTIHSRIHTGEKPFKCSLCDHSARDMSNLLRHVKNHSEEKPFKCSYCRYSTKRKAQLESHLRSHTGEKPYKCSECDFSTADQSNLNRHKKLHSGEKPFKCIFCPYSAARKEQLQNHVVSRPGHVAFDYASQIMSHLQDQGEESQNFSGGYCNDSQLMEFSDPAVTLDDKLFKCNICDYVTCRKSDLKVHKRIHTGEKPFQCDQCDYKASRNTHLKIHIQTHTGEKKYKCNYCDYSALQRFQLNQHEKKHTGEWPFHCTECGYNTAAKSNFSKHLERHKDKVL